MRLLVIEKQPSISVSQIQDGHLAIFAAATTNDALSMLRQDTYDLVLLNITSLGDDDGFPFIRQLRTAHNDTPVVALTGSLADDRTRALSLGADDAVAQPFDPGELRARISAVIRRSKSQTHSTLTRGELSLCTKTREARFNHQPVQLTPMEYAMLELLLLRKGMVITKQMFLNHLYNGLDEPETKIIDVFICKLRRRLNQVGLTNIISTVWGEGYTIHETSQPGRPSRLDTVTHHRGRMVA